MANPTHIQVVNSTISHLDVVLATIQVQTSNPYSTLYNDPSIRNCSDTFRSAVTCLRGEISRNAHETANFLLNNILSSLLKDTVSSDAKKLMIDRFFYAPDPERPSLIGNKARKAANLRHTIEQLQRNLDACQQALEPMGFSPMGIHAAFDIMIEGIRSIQSFYEQACEALQSLRTQLDNGNIVIATVQNEAKWIAAISADLNGLSSSS